MTGDHSPSIRTPDQRIRVFVSSTLRELETERRAVRAAVEALMLAPVMFELGARPHPPRDLYRSYLAQSDIFVGVYADSYGWVAPDEEISGLEDEYRLAPAEMPKLIYLREPAEREERLAALIRRIQDDDTVSYKSFRTPEELAELVRSDLAVLLAERFDAGRDDRRPAQSAPVTAPIPVRYTRLIGRSREIAEVSALLVDGADRLVTLLGPGGIGKSRLALEVADAVSDAFPDGAVFVGLENVLEPQLLLPSIAYALGIRDSGELPVEQRLAMALESRRMLLILDNFEQLVDAASQLVPLYTLAPRCRFLATSRAVLRIRGERVYPVPPLGTGAERAPETELPPEATPRAVDVDAIAALPAVELFVDRARAVAPTFALDTANADDVAQLCRALDGLPLAIELAAARMRLLTPATVLAGLRQGRTMLAGAARDVPERQRTLNATIAWSAGLLAPRERAMLCDLGVFSAGFTLDAVDAIAEGRAWQDDAVESLAALVDSSLVTMSAVGEASVFTMLVTVREYALAQLSDAAERETRDAHARYFISLAAEIGPRLGGPGEREACHRLDLERGNLRTAVRHLIAVRDAHGATSIAWDLYLYWWLRGYFYEVRVWMEELLQAIPDPPPRAYAIARFFVLWSEMWRTDMREDIVAGLQESARRFESTGEQFGADMARATAALARVTMRDPDVADAADDLLRAAERFHASGRRWAETLVWIGLGRLQWALQEPERALDCFRSAEAAARDGGGIFARSIAAHHLARARLFAGDVDAAQRGFSEALGLSLQIEHEEGVAYAVEGLSAVLSVHGDPVGAAVLAGWAAAARIPLTMYDAPQFVFHLGYLDAATSPADREAVAAAMDRGVSWSSTEIARFAEDRLAPFGPDTAAALAAGPERAP